MPNDLERSDRPIVHLATARPRQLGMCVAVSILHVLPHAFHESVVGDELLFDVDTGAAGALYRGQLALEAAVGPDQAQDWQPYVYEEAQADLEDASLHNENPRMKACAEEAHRMTAVAIGQLDRDEPTASQAIADTLGYLLTVCVFADFLTVRQALG